MLVDSNAEKKRLTDLFNAAENATRECFIPKCGLKSIGSHLVQNKGVLSLIADNKGRIVQFKYPAHFEPSKFESKGVKQSTSQFVFPGFCGKHDHQIFKSIEIGKCEYLNTNEFLLLTYRGVLHEMYKQEFLLKYHLSVFNDKDLNISTKYRFIPLQKMMAWRLKSSQYLKLRLEQEIAGDSTPLRLAFQRFELPRLDVVFNSHVSYSLIIPSLSFNEITNMDLDSYIDEVEHNMHFVSFNCFPWRDKSLLIIGTSPNVQFLGSHSLKDVSGFKESQLIKLVSDFLLSGPDTWAISPKLYSEWQAKGIDSKVLEMTDFSAYNKRNGIDMRFYQFGLNMFDS